MLLSEAVCFSTVYRASRASKRDFSLLFLTGLRSECGFFLKEKTCNVISGECFKRMGFQKDFFGQVLLVNKCFWFLSIIPNKCIYSFTRFLYWLVPEL